MKIVLIRKISKTVFLSLIKSFYKWASPVFLGYLPCTVIYLAKVKILQQVNIFTHAIISGQVYKTNKFAYINSWAGNN